MTLKELESKELFMESLSGILVITLSSLLLYYVSGTLLFGIYGSSVPPIPSIGICIGMVNSQVLVSVSV